MSLTIKAGSTDQTIYVFIQDSSQTDGRGLTGLAYNTASLVAYYVTQRGTATAITLATLAAADSAHSDGGFKEVHATNMPGVYRLDLPDAAVATGPEVIVMLKGAANMAQVAKEIQLVAYDPQSATNLGLSKFADIETDTQDIQSRLPVALVSGRIDASVGAMAANVITAAAAAADLTTELQNGLATAAAVTSLQADVTAILADTNELQGDWANGGRLDLILDARASQTSVDTIDGIVDNILLDTAEIGAAGAGLTALASAANLATVAGYIDTEIQTIITNIAALNDITAAEVWSYATRILTAGTNIALAKGTGVTGFNDLDAAGVRSAVGLAAANLDTQLDALPTAAENATAVLTTQMTESYAADGVAPTLAQAAFLTMSAVTQSAVSGTTLTIYKLDGLTAAATFALDSATTPTSRVRAS